MCSIPYFYNASKPCNGKTVLIMVQLDPYRYKCQPPYLATHQEKILDKAKYITTEQLLTGLVICVVV